MEQLFLVCAALGGTVFVCQFVLTLIGLGGDNYDLSHDVPHDFAGGDVGHMDAVHVGHAGAAAHTGDHAADSQAHGHGSTWLFGVISFRTVVAALTFFGLAGYATLQSGQAPPAAIVVAVLCGGAAMYGVHWLMQLMYRLGQDHTLRIGHAVGKQGIVYLPIPGDNRGEGKVHIDVQERLVEYAATTAEPGELSTGARVVVTRIVGPSTVEVRLLPEKVETADG